MDQIQVRNLFALEFEGTERRLRFHDLFRDFLQDTLRNEHEARYRELMGATNPQEAAPGTIRADFASTVDENAVHGSDAPETAAQEIEFFFSEGLCPRTR